MGHLLTILQKKKAIVQDSFNRADSATTMGNTDTGQAWVPSGVWGISSNQSYCTDTVGTQFCLIDALNANVSISAKIKFSVNEGIAFRYSSASNFISARIGSSGNIIVFKVVAGTSTTIGTYSFTPVAGTIYNVKIVCAGSTISVYLDGVLRITVTETFNQTATLCGLRVSASTAGRFDDFLVEAL